MEKVGKAVVWITIVIAEIISWGYVFSTFWAWFIIPIFSLPILNIVQAIGVFTTCKLLTYRSTSIDQKKTPWDLERVLTILLVPWITLGLGKITSLFL